MKNLKFGLVYLLTCLMLLLFLPTEQASAQYGFGFGFRGLIRNRVVQNNLNQQALRDIALRNSLSRNRGFVSNNNFNSFNSVNNFNRFGYGGFNSVGVNVNPGFNNFSFRNNGIIPGRTRIAVNGRFGTVVIDDQRGTFVSINGVLVRVR